MYRSIDADTWSDPWFSELPPPAKLVFLYLITNHHVNAAGLCEITIRVMAFETGLETEQIERLLPKLAPRVMWWKDHSLIWVRNFYKRQRANTNAENFRKSAARITQDAPADVRDVITAQYPELALPAPPPPKKDKDTDASQKADHASPDPAHTSASHTNGIVEPSPTHAHPIRNRTVSVSEPATATEEQEATPLAPTERRARSRRVFTAVVAVCGFEERTITKTARGEINAAVKEIVDAGGNERDVWERADAYIRKYDRDKLTPSSLKKHWPTLSRNGHLAVVPNESPPLDSSWADITFEAKRWQPGTDPPHFTADVDRAIDALGGWEHFLQDGWKREALERAYMGVSA